MVNKWKAVLGVSLALNVLLAGMAIGYFARGHYPHPPPTPPELHGKLSPEHEAVFFSAMRGLRERNRATVEQIDATRKKIIEILSASEFDAAAYQKESDALHELHGKMKTELTQTVLELAKQLNAEERQALAAFLERGPPPGEGGPPHGPPPRDGPPPPPPPL